MDLQCCGSVDDSQSNESAKLIAAKLTEAGGESIPNANTLNVPNVPNLLNVHDTRHMDNQARGFATGLYFEHMQGAFERQSFGLGCSQIEPVGYKVRKYMRLRHTAVVPLPGCPPNQEDEFRTAHFHKDNY